MALADDASQRGLAEELAVRRARLGEPVRIEHEHRAGVEARLAGLVGRVRHDTEQESPGLEPLRLVAWRGEQVGWRVARVGVRQLARGRLVDGEERGDEHPRRREVPGQEGVGAPEHLRGVEPRLHLGMDRGPEAGHHDGRADSVSRDVGDDHAEAPVRKREEVEVIAPDVAGRLAGGGHVHAEDARAGLGKE